MDQEKLAKHFRITNELQRLDKVIKDQKTAVLEAVPEVLRIHPRSIKDSGEDCDIFIEIPEETKGLQETLQSYFKNEPVTLHVTDAAPRKHPLMRALFETDVSDVLDTIHYRDKLYLNIDIDENGAFIDMKLSDDTEEARRVLRNAYPYIRFEFSKNDKELTLHIQ